MMDKRKLHLRRKKRVRVKVFGTKVCPRLSVFRSAKHIYAQIINDSEGKTLLAISDKNISWDKLDKVSKTQMAGLVGEELAGKCKQKKIIRVVFDRGGYKYHGRVKALAEGARKGGLKF